MKDGIFVLDLTNARDRERYESLSEDEKRRFCKPFFKNSEIARYHCNVRNTKVLIYIGKETETLSGYPNVEEHLNRFLPVLQRRREAQNGSIKAFQLQWARTKSIFEGDKIVVPYRTKENAFAFNTGDWFCRSDAYVITPKKNSVNLFTVLGILNSQLTFVWLYNRGKRKGEILELFQVPLSEIPLPTLDEQSKERIANLAQMITERKNDKSGDTSELEIEIDNIIYEAFGLSEEEKNLARTFAGGENNG